MRFGWRADVGLPAPWSEVLGTWPPFLPLLSQECLFKDSWLSTDQALCVFGFFPELLFVWFGGLETNMVLTQ